MSGFQSPNFTQVPNDFFDEYLPELEKSELKLLLVIMRGTFGYHRNEVKLSTREIAETSGLSIASIAPAAEKLEKMGLIEKVTDGNKTLTWRAMVSDSTTGTRKRKSVSTIESRVIQPLNHSVSTIESLSGLNKDKEIKKESDASVFTFYQSNFELLTQYNSSKIGDMIDDYTAEWVMDAFKLCVDQGKKSLAYAGGILKRWQREGKREIQPAKRPEPQPVIIPQIDESQFVPLRGR